MLITKCRFFSLILLPAVITLTVFYKLIKECLNEEQLGTLDGSFIYLTYTDVSVNQLDPDKPFSINFQLKTYNLSRKTSKVSTIFLSKTYFVDYVNPFYYFSSTTDHEAFIIKSDTIETDFNQETLIIVGWNLDNIKTTYIRSYENILSVLANLGGLYSTLFFVTGTLLKPIVQNQCDVHVANEIFNFPQRQLRSKVTNEKVVQILRKSVTINDVRRISVTFKEKLGKGVKDTLKNLLGVNELFNKAKAKVDKYLDLLYLVEMHQSQKKLQKLILDKDQNLIFKLNQKPQCQLDQKDQKMDLTKVYQAYKNLCTYRTPINQNLLENIDNIFKQRILAIDDGQVQILTERCQNQQFQMNEDLNFISSPQGEMGSEMIRCKNNDES